VSAREQRLTAHPGDDQQAPTDAYFSGVADYWGEVYAHDGLQGLVYRERLETVLAWVDALRLPSGAEVLEVGCGAGVATVALARRGLAVESTDSSPDMVARTADRVAAAGLAGAVRLGAADAHDLPHAGGRFALVLAVGVLPWLHSPERAISELARVLAPGGHAIVTADNRWRLNALVEPVQSPLVGPLRLLWHVVRPRRPRSPAATARMHSPRRLDRMLRGARLAPSRRITLGYGPFTFLGRAILPDGPGLRLHLRLKRLATRRVLGLEWTGWHYVVCAKRAG
jgi:SAM-dependent methyltransferase